ncbi:MULTISPECIES: amidase [Legionella]|uniref:Amidase n=1 Tax=Legionella drozanskii LLAP-1 TaxID=1212489 RepID=A0A0W0SXG1_9GAMM|nr:MULTISPECIES: amidase [Legionella]KTC88038.1 amidase [Legionella drozanskii LLAP-1]PJE07358.1 MAG: amidase [Legionella sp.]
MQFSEYYKQDAHGLAKLIRTKQISAEEALDCAIKRMHEVNPVLNAIVADCSDWAYQQLKLMRGDEPLYGVPVLVKDLGFMIEGVPYTAGSRFCASAISPITSDFIKRLLALGMLPFATTNVPELGLSYVTESILHGPCKNPYDLKRTPGGSSGGSAAAVAAGIAPVATGNDGGGSIRIPASCCGLFGFKPTPGLISTGPLVGEAWSGLATSHVLTRSVRDSALLFDLLTVANLKNPGQSVHRLSKQRQSSRPLTIALLEGAFAPVPVAKPCIDVLEQAIRLLTSLGHHVVKRKLDLNLAEIGESVITMIAANTCAEIEYGELIFNRKVKKNELEPVTWEFMTQGKTISASQLIMAKNKVYQHMRPVHELFMEIDVILTPALAQLPLLIGSLATDDNFADYLQKNTEFSPFTSLFNQAGLPAMTIPVMYHERLPLAVQFAAAKGQDKLLLDLASQLQKEFVEFRQPELV